ELLLTAHFLVLATGLLLVAGEDVADGLAAACGVAEAAGLAAGEALGVAVAIRIPLILSGLETISAASLFSIFASLIATSSKAAFKMSLRCLTRPSVMSLRTSGLSSVRFSVCKRLSVNLKMNHWPLLMRCG